MAQNIKPAAAKAGAQKPDDPTLPKNSSKKMLMGIIGALVLLLAGGAGWYFTKANHADHAEEVKVEPPKTPIFVALEPFTVNLQRESSDQYLQMGISLKVFELEIEAKIKASLPEIRSKILQLLTTKTATELLTAEGKTQLVKEILTLSNSTIGIVAAPAQAGGAHTPAIASQVHAADALAQALPVAASSPEHAPKPAAKLPLEKKGIIDVLFTSFIIQ